MIVHELGHLIVARRCNVRASEIGLGIGPRLFGIRLGGIRLSLRAFPVGSFVMLDGSALEERTAQQQLCVHLGGIIFNAILGLASYGTIFGWMNLLLAGGNLLPLYQHDGWKCGVVIMRALLRRESQPIERAFTFSGGFLSLVVVFVIIRVFI
ncbi:MAG: site-2 protease family protein [Acidobacteriota bacterium]|nr:site-2 protease family protein [Acidobacteriota bacterium]